MGIETELEKIIDGGAVVDERREGGDDVLLNKTKVFNLNTQFVSFFYCFVTISLFTAEMFGPIKELNEIFRKEKFQ